MASYPEATLSRDAQPAPSAHHQEILRALEGGATHVTDRPESPGSGFGRVGAGVFGIVSLMLGTVSVFFFTILGALLLFTGSAACVYALQSRALDARVDD